MGGRPEYVTLRDAIARLAIGLERRFEARAMPDVGAMRHLRAESNVTFVAPSREQWQVVQRCRVCASELVTEVETDTAGRIERAELYAAVFGAYDAHACRPAIADREKLYNDLERESVRMATRAQALQAADLELAERAEHESVMLAGWAADLAKQV